MMTIVSRFSILLAEKELRDGRKYTYRDIEEITKVDKNTIGLWVNGKIQRFDATTLDHLCKFLECKPGDLIILTDGPDTTE